MKNDLKNFAEVCGIHTGDGYLRNDGKRIELEVGGNINEEKKYYDSYVIPLFKRTLGINIKGKFFKSKGTYGFVIREKDIIELFNKVGFPYGKKESKVKVPELIISSNSTEVTAAFLRGYFDADGSLSFDKKVKKHNYPRIMLGTVSKELFTDLKKMLKSLKFKFSTDKIKSKNVNERIRYRIWIYGKENLEKWMKIVGSKNSSKFSRYLIWKKFGFCPPKTSYVDRINMLKQSTTE